MFIEIFDKHQEELLTCLKVFKNRYFLVGGTAIALHLGHRRSLDFDLFTNSPLTKSRLKKQLSDIPFRQITLFEDIDQLHVMLNNVKVTFFYYPYAIHCPNKLSNGLKYPDLLTLAAMKSFALSRRAKWKDYVDLYFILKFHFSTEEICEKAMEIFGDQFAEKLFRQQLAFHKDIDYTESVDYLVEAPADEELRTYLVQESVRIL